MAPSANEIRGTAKLVIRDGKLEEFKRLNAKCIELSRTKDTGILEYDTFITADQTACFVHER